MMIRILGNTSKLAKERCLQTMLIMCGRREDRTPLREVKTVAMTDKTATEKLTLQGPKHLMNNDKHIKEEQMFS